MRKFLLSLIGAALLIGCQSENKGGYTITGQAEGTVDGDSVFLCEMQGYFSLIPQDTAIVKNGKFTFEGEIDGAQLRFIMPMHEGEGRGMAMIVLENSPISVNIFADEQKQAEVKGGPNGELYNAFESEDPYMAQLTQLYEQGSDSTKTEDELKALQGQIEELSKKQHEWQYDYVMKNIPSGFADMMLAYAQWSEEELDAILEKMGQADVQYGFYNAIMEERKAAEATAVGQQYIDLEMESPEGKMIKVSDYVSKNKYTLVDFWASWCGPCRAEMPNVVNAYNTYHDKGFEVVGVSFDNDKEAWINSIEKLNMPWPQMSDLKGWECAAAGAYNVRAIPANVLIDQEGRIVAKDLREEALQQKLAELFSE